MCPEKEEPVRSAASIYDATSLKKQCSNNCFCSAVASKAVSQRLKKAHKKQEFFNF